MTSNPSHHQQAIEAYQRALALDPSNAEADRGLSTSVACSLPDGSGAGAEGGRRFPSPASAAAWQCVCARINAGG
jgi:hypothetical protein